MGNITHNSQRIDSPMRYQSIGRTLVFWFLILSLVPLVTVSWIGYQETKSNLTNSAIEKLEKISELNSRYVKNWFNNRLTDLEAQGKTKTNILLLQALEKGFERSELSLSAYVKNTEWVTLTNLSKAPLVSFSENYEYIYDVFLIDKEGNLLFTVAGESDLGTNLFTGPYSKTNFSHIVKQSLETGKSLFSDLERYSPSGDRVTGFLTTPLVDDKGATQGVFAFQIKIEKIIDAIHNHVVSHKSHINYVVGNDGKLRTFLSSDENEILTRTINTPAINSWIEKNNLTSFVDQMEQNQIFEYTSPTGKMVIGKRDIIDIAGVKWAFISEFDHDEVFASVMSFVRTKLLLFFLTATIVALIAIVQAKRLTRPIIELADASMKVASGQTDQHVSVDENNEIGRLASAFNHMIEMQKNHEQTLLETNQQTQLAINELADQQFALDQHAIVSMANLTGNITFVNDKFIEISGYSREELIGSNHRILNSGYHEPRFFSDMYQTITKGKVWQNEVCNISKNGHLYWVETTIVPLLGSDRKPKKYISIRTDISEIKRAEHRLTEAKRSAEETSQLKSDFLANMSHEIRTPMNGVIGMTGLLLDTKLSAKQRDYAENTMKSADALLSIINDILDFSKIEAGKLELEAVPFDLCSLAEDVAELMALRCREKKIEMLLRYKPGTERLLIGDPGRVRQILLNLLSNAVKFTQEGNVLLSIESYGGTDDNVSVLVKVEDTGEGIDQSKLEKVFNKFEQEDASTTRKFGGTGLGLAICQELCHLMQGDLVVKSVKGKGSLFSFTMTLGLDKKGKEAQIESDKLLNLSDIKILIVDDIDIANLILGEQLSGLNLVVETATSGSQALKMLSDGIENKSPFDIVITDYKMPDFDGETLAEKIKQDKLLEGGALLLVTSFPARKNDERRLKNLGFDGYLTKPTHPSEVPQIVAMVWKAVKQGDDFPLITRHSLRDSENIKIDKPRFKDVHILITEDNSINLMVATEYLEGYGCTITPAGNGLEALNQIDLQNFDLVFMDCQMPEMDGFEATREIRNRKINSDSPLYDRIPIIAFTANAMQGDKEKCEEAGMDDFISKPVNQKTLEDTLKKWLSHKLDGTVNTKLIGEELSDHNLISAEEDESFIDSKRTEQLDLKKFETLKVLFKDQFSSVVEQHSKSTYDNILLIREAIKKSDFETLERAAHSIKGASAQFGAIRLSQAAEVMEDYARNKDLKEINEHVVFLESEHVSISDVMKKYLGDI